MNRVRHFAPLLALGLISFGRAAPEPELPRVPPKSPADSLKAFEVKTGFKVELVAAEPLVQSPMACEFDELGRLWIVELPEYNDYAATKPHGKGRIVRLEDTDGDGVFDKRIVFADGLNYPTGVFPWDGGVYVGAAPELLYLKDSKGDGKADVRRVILSGFGTDKAGEGQLNSFRWTLDNRLLLSTGLDGGEVPAPGEKGDKKLSLRAMNILIDPRTNAYELTSGGGQHGMSLDDWGRSYVSGNSDPIHALAYDARYLAGEKNIQAPAAAVNVLPSGKFTKLHRISEIEPWREMRTRLRKSGTIPGSDEGGTPSGFFTGATGVTVYRGDAFPAEYRGDLFVGEVANNLVFRAKVKANGVLPLAERADPDKEFLASRDTWFRPVQFANAPDGCLYVVDMSRELIEGAAFLAPQVLKNVDPSAGFDRGRIWRIVPEGFKRPALPNLAKASAAELVNLLDHSNGWHRDTASRLLHQRQDQPAIDALKHLVREGKTPQGRLHALASLASRKALDAVVLRTALKDTEPRVREHAVRFCESRYHGEKFGLPGDLVLALWDVRRDADPAVRVQLAYTLGHYAEHDRDMRDYSASRAAIFVQLAMKDAADPWMRLALVAGMRPEHQAQVFQSLGTSRYFAGTEHGPAFLLALGERVAAADEANGPVIFEIISHLARFGPGPLARALLTVVKTRGSASVLAHFNDPNFADQVKSLTDRLLADAVLTARDMRKPSDARVPAIKDLTILSFAEAAPILKELLQPAQPPTVQIAALDIVGRFGDDGGPGLLLAAWPAMTPQVRATATEVWLSRNNWVSAFLDAVEERKVNRADVDPARVALLKKSPARNISARAAKLFVAPPDRQKVFEEYRKSLDVKGDAAKGKTLFKTNCTACHKLDGVGEEVGADLKAIRDRGLEGVLLAIIDPNREVKPQFLTYTVELKNGRQLSGLLQNETATGFTLRRADGQAEIVRRSDVESLKSSGLSYMPEGLEKQIDVPAMADLLAYLNSVK